MLHMPPSNKLEIVIPSKGRADWKKQVTLKQFMAAGKHVTLVVPAIEAPEYRDLLIDRGRQRGGLVRIAKCPCNGIGETRRWITRKLFTTEKVAMFDDDLYFSKRPDMASPKLAVSGPMDVRAMLLNMSILLDTHVMVGISARQGNNNTDKPVVFNTRAMNAYAFDLRKLREAGIKFGRMPLMEDFDITLQLLRAGYSNAVLYNFVWNQSGSNASGGCSEYRTARMQAQAAKRLKELHSDFVKLVVKKNVKHAWKGMKTRTDVRISWAKAAKEGREYAEA